MIKKPTGPTPVIEFESDAGIHQIKVTTLNHLYGEAERAALSAAKKVDGSVEEVRSMTIYDFFHQKITDYFSLPKTAIAEEQVHLIAMDMQDKLNELKKTCLSTDGLQS